MRDFLRRCRGVFGMGVTWAVAWAALFFALGVVIGIIDPDSIDPGEEPNQFARIGAIVGFIAGAAFGLLILFAEARKKLLNLSLARAGLWGAIASSLFPLLTSVNDSMVIFMAPIGAVLGAASVGAAKRVERTRSHLLR
jgi:Mg/Co/Ni transporter MgtE